MTELAPAYPINSCGIIILAAGTSSRLGTAKQLLIFQGKTLLQHSIDVARSMLMPVILVLGANMEALINQTDTTGVYIAKNENWARGMASSICTGLKALKISFPACDAAIFMVCDQPFVEQSLLSQLLVRQKETGMPVVASNYEQTNGVPALFHQMLFPRLMELKGDAAAKKFMHLNPGLITSVPFPSGNRDIDTMEDYHRLNSEN